jgi:hypothetical protein
MLLLLLLMLMLMMMMMMMLRCDVLQSSRHPARRCAPTKQQPPPT